MVIVHIASIDPAVLGGVNVAVPRMLLSQSEHAQVCLVNLFAAKITGIPTFSAEEFTENALPAPFNRPTLAVFHEVYRPAFLSLARLLRKRGIPYIVVPHGCLTGQAQKRKWLKKAVANVLLFGPFLKKARAIQYLSESEQSRSVFRCPGFVSGNGVEIPGPIPTKTPADGCRLLYIGRLEIAIKGLDILLDALAKDAQLLRQSRCRLDIYGPDSEDAHAFLRRRSAQLGIDDLVSVHDAVVGEEKRKLLLQADYFIQTSRSEGMPMGILEALSYGLPCIVTAGTGLAALVEENGAGFGCETSVQGIADALCRALREQNARPAQAKAAARLAAECFDCHVLAAEAVAHYREICQK
ncbi:MAG: glycosyltransferase [Oscillospiraceae bacterium]|nr:glycosyltransferase [Oscillospiraceae bacterium]